MFYWILTILVKNNITTAWKLSSVSWQIPVENIITIDLIFTKAEPIINTHFDTSFYLLSFKKIKKKKKKEANKKLTKTWESNYRMNTELVLLVIWWQTLRALTSVYTNYSKPLHLHSLKCHNQKDYGYPYCDSWRITPTGTKISAYLMEDIAFFTPSH